MATREVSTEPKGLSQKRRLARALRPLAPSTYLLRNAGKTIPLTGVIILAVMLVGTIISLINSIPYSIRTIYDYSREMLGVTPRGDTTQTRVILDEIKKISPVPIDRIMVARVSSGQVQSIVGSWPFLVIGLEQKDFPYYLKRMDSKGVQGRLPTPGEPEVVVSRPVARNLNLRIYDPNGTKKEREHGILQSPLKPEMWSPCYVKIVGILDTDRWVMLNTIEYQRANHFPPIDVGMVFARNYEEQSKLDHWAEKRFKSRRAQILAYHQLEKNTEAMFKTLYRILDVVIGILVLVITFMMGMLINIYQTQRLVEFGLLQAIGYTRNQLLRRVLFESLAVVTVGWVLGLFATYGLLNVAKVVLMDPKAFQLNTLDPIAYRYTVPLPFAILVVAAGTVMVRFRKFDPVAVVERRLV